MITAALVIFPALVTTLIKVLVRKEDLPENYILPVAFELFFEVVDLPTYLLAFLWQFSNTFAIAYTKKIVSVAFYIDCFQAIAVMRDLQLMAGEFNQYRFVFRFQRIECNNFSKYSVPGQKAFDKRKAIWRNSFSSTWSCSSKYTAGRLGLFLTSELIDPLFNSLMHDFEEYGSGYVFAEFLMCVMIVGSIGIIMIMVSVLYILLAEFPHIPIDNCSPATILEWIRWLLLC